MMTIRKSLLIATLALTGQIPFSVVGQTQISDEDYARCLQALKNADLSGDNRLSKDPEYINFLKEITGSDFVLTTYDDLPEAMQMNFEIYENEDVVDIRGATRGEDATKRQKRVTETFCETTYLAINAVPADDPSRNNKLDGIASLAPTDFVAVLPGAQTGNDTAAPAEPAGNSTLNISSSIVPSTTSNLTSSPTTVSPTTGPVPTTAAPVATASPSAATVPPVSSNPTTLQPSSSAPTTAPATASPVSAQPVAATQLPQSEAPVSVAPTASAVEGNSSSTHPAAAAPTATPTTLAIVTPAPTPSVENSTNSASIGTTEAPQDASTVAPSASLNATVPPTTSSNETSPPSIESTPVSTPVNSTNNNVTLSTTAPTTQAPTSLAPSTAAPTVARATVPTMGQIDPPTEAPIVTTTQPSNNNLNEEEPPPPPETVTNDPYEKCKMVLKISDLDGDNTINKMEYVFFLNDGWSSPYEGVQFQDLPQGLKDNFYGIASTELDKEKIDVVSMTPEQKDNFCNSTTLAVANGPMSDAASVEEATMAIFKRCIEADDWFDSNKDRFVDQAEYVALIHDLSDGKFGKTNFDTLPEGLKGNFFSLTDTKMIDLGGSQTGEIIEGFQQELLDTFCGDTSYALHEAFIKGPGEQEQVEEEGTDPVMMEYAICIMQMADLDINKDSKLDEQEYVALVNQMGDNIFEGMSFSDLPPILRDNFAKLETNGTINIEGSQAEGQIPTMEQQQFLGQVCVETTAAVNMEIESEEPVSSSETMNPDVEMGEPLVVHSSFNIYSDVLIPEHEFMMGATREVLQEAYKQFVMEVVDGISSKSNRQRRRLLPSQRELQGEDNDFLAILNRDSPTVYHIVDLSCAGASQDAMCKTVFAQYEITPILSMDRQALYDEYVRVTQQFIDTGLLQSVLERIDPDSLIAIIGASEPVVFQETAPSSAPNDVPLMGDAAAYQEKMEKNKKKTIALIAVAVGCLLFASLIGLVGARLRKRRKAAARAEASGENGSATDGSLGEKASETASKDEELQQQEEHEEEVAEIEEQEGESSNDNSQGSRGGFGSRIFRSRRASLNKAYSEDDDVTDDDLGKMQVIDLCEGVNAAANDFEAIGNKHLKDLAEQEEGNVNVSCNDGESGESSDTLPPLKKTKKTSAEDATGGLGSPASEASEISFAFRRYAMEGERTTL